MATVEQLAQALAEVRQQLGEAQRLAQEAQVDPREMNKCPTFSGRDTEWSEHFTGSAEKPIAEFTLEMKLGAKQLYYLLVNTIRGKPLTLVQSADKHHGIAAWKRIKTEYQPGADGRHTAVLMGIMQPCWDSRNAVNFLDPLIRSRRRNEEYEGESLETFSDGMKIAVLASHAPESMKCGQTGSWTSWWEVSNGATEHDGVSSIWPSLRQGWSKSGLGTQQCERDSDGH